MTKSALTHPPRPLRNGALALLLAGTLLGACSSVKMESVHGYRPDDQLLAGIKTGVTSRAEVSEKLGSPTTASNLKQETWYYISQKTERVAFLPEKTLSQEVVSISFDRAGVVSEVKQYTLADGENIAFNDRTTPTRGREMTVLEQFFGNLGRFSKQDDKRR